MNLTDNSLRQFPAICIDHKSCSQCWQFQQI